LAVIKVLLEAPFIDRALVEPEGALPLPTPLDVHSLVYSTVDANPFPYPMPMPPLELPSIDIT